MLPLAEAIGTAAIATLVLGLLSCTREYVSASDPESPRAAATVHQLTLSFSDAGIEREYVLARFQNSRLLTSAFCIFQSLLVVTFWLCWPVCVCATLEHD